MAKVTENAVDPAPEMPEVITAYKGFDKYWKCRGYQFAVGQTYTHEGKVKACSSGFHACENPMDVLSYYPLIGYHGAMNKFAVVKAIGTISRHADDADDSKIASASLTVEAELNLSEFISAAIKWMVDAYTDNTSLASGESSQLAASGHSSKLAASGNYSRLAASGHSSQLAASGHSSKLAASGHSSKLAASGNYSKLAASGNYSQLAASGHSSKLAASGHSSQLAASGDYSKLAASGDYSKLAASGHSSKLAASGNYSQLAASGDSSQLAASGNYSQLAASGDSSQLAASGNYSQLAVAGENSIVCAAATDCTASAGKNGCIVLTRWVESENRYRVSVAYVGENGIKPDVFYKLDEHGELVAVA